MLNRILIGLLTCVCVLGLSGCEQELKPSRSFEVATVGAQGAALSDDGSYAVIGSVHQGGSLWRVNDGERLYNWNHRQDQLASISNADFSPDGNWALTADSHTMVLWDMQDGSAFRFWTAPGEVLSVSLSMNGNYALLGLSDFSAVLFDVKRGGIRRTFRHQGRVRSVALSDDGRLALTGSEDYTAVLWDVASGKPLHSISHDDDVQLVALSPDGKRALSAAKYDKAVVWDTGSGQVIGNIPLSTEKVRRGVRFTTARFSANGRLLLTGLPDRVVQLWDSTSMKELGAWVLPKRDAWKPTGSSVLAVAFAKQDNRYFAIASNGMVHQLDR